MPEPLNEITFVAKLGAFTAVRAAAAKANGTTTFIATGDVEEAQRDPVTGTVRRCDMRLATAGGRKLLSGEMKRPEIPEGRDPRNIDLINDARNKAVARGLPLYFTCNMAKIVLFEVSIHPGVPDRELGEFDLAPVARSADVEAYFDDIEVAWSGFLDEVERHLTVLAEAQPAPTSMDVIRLQQAIATIAGEVLLRAERHLFGDPDTLDATRAESALTFGYPFPLEPRFRAHFRQELAQVLRLSAFVVAQKLILHRVLAQTGQWLPTPFHLDAVAIPNPSTDPVAVKQSIDRAIAQAIKRSGDYETAFLLTPNEDLLFLEPTTSEEVQECTVGAAWSKLVQAIDAASWAAISHNLIGFLYEAIVDAEYRHALGQHYTQENVVDLLSLRLNLGPLLVGIGLQD